MFYQGNRLHIIHIHNSSTIEKNNCEIQVYTFSPYIHSNVVCRQAAKRILYENMLEKCPAMSVGLKH